MTPLRALRREGRLYLLLRPEPNKPAACGLNFALTTHNAHSYIMRTVANQGTLKCDM